MASHPMRLELDPSRLRPVEVPVHWGSNERLRKATGWEPTIPIHQSLAATRQLDQIVRDLAQPERRAVDEPKLALLNAVDRPGARIVQRLGQEENRRQRRTQVVRNLHDQLEPIGSRQARGESLAGVGIEVRLNPLEDAEQLHRIQGRRDVVAGTQPIE